MYTVCRYVYPTQINHPFQLNLTLLQNHVFFCLYGTQTQPEPNISIGYSQLTSPFHKTSKKRSFYYKFSYMITGVLYRNSNILISYR